MHFDDDLTNTEKQEDVGLTLAALSASTLALAKLVARRYSTALVPSSLFSAVCSCAARALGALLASSRLRLISLSHSILCASS